MRDLFQTVFELKKQEIELTRQQQIMKGSGLYLEALASTTSKIDHVCFFLLDLKFYLVIFDILTRVIHYCFLIGKL